MWSLRAFLAIPLVAAAGWAAGAPAATSRPVVTTVQRPAAKPAPPARSDADIEKDIRARLAKSKIAPEKFQVHVQGGVATLVGKTDVIQHKGVATRLAKSGGAIAVQNHIEVSEAAKEKAAGNLEAGRRRAQVKRGDSRSEARSETSRQSH